MKKKLVCLATMLCMVLGMTGCKTNLNMAYTFNVETGDSIKVKLDIKDNYKLSSDVPFVISCEDETLSQGMFIYADAYEQYVEAAETDEKAEILDSGEKDGNEYVFWSYDDSEFNYAILIEDSDTAILLGNNVSEESAKECFERLTISVDD